MRGDSPQSPRGPRRSTFDRILTDRNLSLRILPFVLIAFVTLLGSHSLRRILDEWQLQRHPIVLLTLATPVAGLALVAFRRSRALVRLLPILLACTLVANVALFEAADPSERIPTLTLRPDARLSSLDPMPGWRNHWNIYHLYGELHEVVRGASIHAPAPLSNATHPQFEGWFHPYYLRYISESAELRDLNYPDRLSFADSLWLLSLAGPPTEDYATKTRWRIIEPGALTSTQPVTSAPVGHEARDHGGRPLREDYYVLVGLDQCFLAPASIVARLSPP